MDNLSAITESINLIYFFSAPASLHCKKSVSNFPSPAGMSLIKLSLGGNNLIIPVQGEYVSDIPDGEGKIDNLFYSVTGPCTQGGRDGVRGEHVHCRPCPRLPLRLPLRGRPLLHSLGGRKG
jgi:hypothetical protein